MKAQSVNKELKIKLLHMIASDTDDLESFHSIMKLDGGQEENEVLDELFNGKLNFALLIRASFFSFFFRLVEVILWALHTRFIAESDSR